MGWCHEFGPQIREGCGHPMRAGESACVCPQSALSDMSDNRDSEVATALAEVKGWAAELRNETLRLQGFEKAVAEQLRSDVSTTIEQGVERMAGAREDDVRQALADVEERA